MPDSSEWEMAREINTRGRWILARWIQPRGREIILCEHDVAFLSTGDSCTLCFAQYQMTVCQGMKTKDV